MQHQQASEAPDRARPARSLRISRAWLLQRLDALLSEPLRRGSPAELARARVLAGFLAIMVVFIVLFLASIQATEQPWTWTLPIAVAAVSSVGALALLRRARSITAASMVMCVSIAVGMVVSVIVYRDPFAATHAAVVLAPAAAVYLMGPRWGLVIAGVATAGSWSAAVLVQDYLGTVAHGEEHLWLMCIATAMAVTFVWALGWLYTTARDEAQAALELALRELGESERRLISLFENTGDMVCSLDRDGRLVLFNTAMRDAYVQRFGKEPAAGGRLFAGVVTANGPLWKRKLGEAFAGRRTQIEVEYEVAGERYALEASLGPIQGEDGQIVGVVMFGRDTTARRQAEQENRELHRTLIDMSRQAGMAEIATGLFHNVVTTKKTGHGFGLHISALAAVEMKGSLSCASPGPGHGATFTIELPLGPAP